jgi:hypothetical protein
LHLIFLLIYFLLLKTSVPFGPYINKWTNETFWNSTKWLKCKFIDIKNFVYQMKLHFNSWNSFSSFWKLWGCKIFESQYSPWFFLNLKVCLFCIAVGFDFPRVGHFSKLKMWLGFSFNNWLKFMEFFDKLKNYDNNKLYKLPKFVTSEKASIFNFFCKWNDYNKYLWSNTCATYMFTYR